MIKFDKRNTLKKKLDQIQKPIYVDEKEVRFTHLGKNIGNEEDGSGTKFKRPVLVIKRL